MSNPPLDEFTSLSKPVSAKDPNKLDQLIEGIQKFTDSIQNILPIKFNLKYLPEKDVDFQQLNKKALLGAAFEDLGKSSVSVEEYDEKLNKNLPQNLTAKAFDINGDGQISFDENAVAILIKDMADAHPTEQVVRGCLKRNKK